MKKKKVMIVSIIGVICGLAIVTGGTYYICKKSNSDTKQVVSKEIPPTISQYVAYGKKIQNQNYNDMINGLYAGAYDCISVDIPLKNAKKTLDSVLPVSNLYYSDAAVLNGFILDIQTAQTEGLQNVLSQLNQYNVARNSNINGFNLAEYNKAYNTVVKDIQTTAQDGIKAISYQSKSDMNNYNIYQNQRNDLSNKAILDFEAFRESYVNILQGINGNTQSTSKNTNNSGTVQTVLNDYTKQAQALAYNQKMTGIKLEGVDTQAAVQNSMKYLNSMKQIIVNELNALSTVMPQTKVTEINSNIVKILNTNKANFELKAQQNMRNQNAKNSYVNMNMANTYENLIVNLNQYI